MKLRTSLGIVIHIGVKILELHLVLHLRNLDIVLRHIVHALRILQQISLKLRLIVLLIQILDR